MTKEELLRIMRLLSAMESVMMTDRDRRFPDYLHEEIAFIVERLEAEILK